MNPYAVKYGLGRAWGGAVLTFGMWLVFWFHRTRRLLDGELGGSRDDAVLRALLALQGSRRAPALGRVNEFWDVRTQGLAADAPITGSEKVLFAVGATLWVMSSAWMVLWVLVLAGSGPLVDVV